MNRDELIASLTFEPVEWSTLPEGLPTYMEIRACRKQEAALIDRVLVPGAVVKLQDGSTHLIGHVNTLLGVCDDCKDFDSRAIVAVAYLWK